MVNAGKAVRLAQETVKAVKKRVQAGKSPQAELARVDPYHLTGAFSVIGA